MDAQAEEQEVVVDVFQVVPGAPSPWEWWGNGIKAGQLFLKFSSAGVELDPCETLPPHGIP